MASVKTNFGHAVGRWSAGMKAVLALQHGVVPRICTSRPCLTSLPGSNLFVPQELHSGPGADQETPRRAAVSSYGVTGTNVRICRAGTGASPRIQCARHPHAPVSTARCCSRCRPALQGMRCGRPPHWPVGRRPGPELAPADGPTWPAGATPVHRRTGRHHRGLTEALREVAAGEPLPTAVGRVTRTTSGCSRARLAMGGPGRRAAGHQYSPPLSPRSNRDRRGIRLLGDPKPLTAPEVVTGIDRCQPTLFAMRARWQPQ